MDKWEVLPRMYKAIVETLKDNMPHIKYLAANNTVAITKLDMIFAVTHKDEVQEVMELMWKINNFICRQYRRRKHILGSTRLIEK